MPARAEIVARIRTVWGLGRVPYSMSSTASPTGHRCDCSGYASAVWGLPTPGLSTVTLVTAGAMYELHDLDQLLPGDALAIAGPGTDGANGHIQIFESWNADNTMTIVEQGGGYGPTVSRIAGPITDNRGTFRPYRLTNITEDEDMALTPDEVTAIVTATWARLGEDTPEGDDARALVGQAVWNYVLRQLPDFPNPYGFSQGQIQHGTNTAAWAARAASEASLAILQQPPKPSSGVPPHDHWMPDRDPDETTGGVANG